MPTVRRSKPHRVVCLVADGVNAFELGTVSQVFTRLPPGLVVPWWYSLTLCTQTPGPVRTAAGFDISVPAGLDALRRADTIVVPATDHSHDEDVSPAVAHALRLAYNRRARIASICTGAFTLASAGLLDSLEATTHWRFASLLQERFPEVRVRPRVLYIDSGQVLTSAGVMAGVDLCLHIVRRDHGHETASRVANWMAVAAHREGGQSQFMEQPVATAPADDPIAAAVGYARDNLAGDLSIETLARVAMLSTRQFERRFATALCSSPARWVTRERIQTGRELLAGSELAVDVIAERVGMSFSGFRAHFKQEIGVSPAAYRRQHREGGARGQQQTA